VAGDLDHKVDAAIVCTIAVGIDDEVAVAVEIGAREVEHITRSRAAAIAGEG